jgi:hypothetical protein
MDIELEGVTFVTQTPNAIYILYDGEAWIPKSQLLEGSDDVTGCVEGDKITIVIPEWLAVEKDIL